MRQSLSRDLMDLIRHWAYHERQVHVYGLQEPLYRSEIHVIWLLGTEPDLYGLKLAQKIGVTKSAASQLLSKLEKRGMICSHLLKKDGKFFISMKKFTTTLSVALVIYCAAILQNSAAF